MPEFVVESAPRDTDKNGPISVNKKINKIARRFKTLEIESLIGVIFLMFLLNMAVYADVL